MTFVFYDTETTGTDTAFDQILQFGAIRTDDDLNEIGRFEICCRLQPHPVPAPMALKVRSSVHPRVCGEQVIPRSSSCCWTGSSPRVRGTAPHVAQIRFDGSLVTFDLFILHARTSLPVRRFSPWHAQPNRASALAARDRRTGSQSSGGKRPEGKSRHDNHRQGPTQPWVPRRRGACPRGADVTK